MEVGLGQRASVEKRGKGLGVDQSQRASGGPRQRARAALKAKG